jgi:hypothetical protein
MSYYSLCKVYYNDQTRYLPMWGLRAVTNIKLIEDINILASCHDMAIHQCHFAIYIPLVHDLLDLLFVSLDTNNAVLLERDTGIGQQTDRLKEVLNQDRLENIELLWEGCHMYE